METLNDSDENADVENINRYIDAMKFKKDILNLDRKIITFRKKGPGSYYQEFDLNIAESSNASKLNTFFTAKLLFEMLKDHGVFKLFHIYVDPDNGNFAILYVLFKNYFKNVGVTRKYSLLYMRRSRNDQNISTFVSVPKPENDFANENISAFLTKVNAINAEHNIDAKDDELPLSFTFLSTPHPLCQNRISIKGVTVIPESFQVPEVIEKVALQLVTALVKQSIKGFLSMQL